MKTDFLGFPYFVCEACKRDTTYPLGSGYRIAWYVLLLLLPVGIYAAANQHVEPALFLFGGAAAFALVRDHGMKQAVAAAEAKKLGSPEEIARTFE